RLLVAAGRAGERQDRAGADPGGERGHHDVGEQGTAPAGTALALLDVVAVARLAVAVAAGVPVPAGLPVAGQLAVPAALAVVAGLAVPGLAVTAVAGLPVPRMTVPGLAVTAVPVAALLAVPGLPVTRLPVTGRRRVAWLAGPGLGPGRRLQARHDVIGSRTGAGGRVTPAGLGRVGSHGLATLVFLHPHHLCPVPGKLSRCTAGRSRPGGSPCACPSSPVSRTSLEAG